ARRLKVETSPPPSPPSTEPTGSRSCRGCWPVCPTPPSAAVTPRSCSRLRPLQRRLRDLSDSPVMRFATLRRPRSGDRQPGVLGAARLDRRTKRLTKRLHPGDIAIIDHVDL